MTELAVANISPGPTIHNPPLSPEPKSPFIRDIVRLVAIYYRCSPREITGKSRRWVTLRPRHMAIYLAHKITGKSSVFIGRYMGNRDHSSILWALRKMDALLLKDHKLASEYHDLYDSICEEYGL